jgi:glucose/mannose transport system substrate-binding protein
MIAEYKNRNPGTEFVNAAVVGGAGTNAKRILDVRLDINDPPDSYQRHAGLELQEDVSSDKVSDLSYLYDQFGWREKLPKGLLDTLTIDGRLYAVPVNVHRANLLWYDPRALAELGLGGPPRKWSEFLTQAARIRAKGRVPLAVGPSWTQKQLLETVLLGELGADAYTGLWNGSTAWGARSVVAALEVFKKVIAQSDVKAPSSDWQPALDKVIDGRAVYHVTGDWAEAYLNRTRGLKFRVAYDAVPTPGSDGVYDFLSDSFTLPVRARHRDAAEQWLALCGSAEGQDLFNPLKGSVPARVDANRARYDGYLATAIKAWQDPATRIVGSLAHGAVANNAWSTEIDLWLGRLVQNGDSSAFAANMTKTYAETR